MEVLAILLVLVALIAGAFALFWGALIALIILWCLLIYSPIIIGALLAAWLWANGHDNLGVIAVLLGAAGYGYIHNMLETGSTPSSWSEFEERVKKIYNRAGEVIGYIDKK